MSNYRSKIPAEVAADSIVLSNNRPTCKAVSAAADGLDFNISGSTGNTGKLSYSIRTYVPLLYQISNT